MNNKIFYTTRRVFSIEKLQLTAISITLLMISCQKDVTNIKLPNSEPKLVVGCFISPQDSLITVTLTRSNPIFGSGHNASNTNPPVEDASVIISNGSSSISIPYSAGHEKYALLATAFPIIAGQTYSLSISTPKGENVTGSCIVPSSNISSLSIHFADTTNYSHKFIVFKWQDIPNEVNYYKVTGYAVAVDTITQNDTSYIDSHSRDLINDDQKDGFELYSMVSGWVDDDEMKIVALDIYVINIDKNYYNYQHSLDNYVDDDPFAEPTPLYTNIKGGLGVFASYQQYYVRLP